jgi:hypothetical protein
MERAPAKRVKCPYCEHKGSARGLFSHIRLMHPKLLEKSRELTRETREHPCDDVKNTIKRVKARLNGRTHKTPVDPWISLSITIAALVVTHYLNKQSQSRGVDKSPSETNNEIAKVHNEVVRTLGAIGY